MCMCLGKVAEVSITVGSQCNRGWYCGESERHDGDVAIQSAFKSSFYLMSARRLTLELSADCLWREGWCVAQ